MIPALTVAIITTGALLMLGIGILIARNGKPFPKRSEGIETKAERDARLAKPLPPARDELTEPVRRIPGTHMAPELVDGTPPEPVPLEFIERLHAALTAPEPPPWPWTLTPEPGLSTRYYAYEALGVNRVRTVEEILRPLGDVTVEFNRLMSAEFSEQKCDSCSTGRDGEHQHQSCVGCSCHCGDSQGAQVVHVGEAGRNAWMEAA
jgi:hypothetical protein